MIPEIETLKKSTLGATYEHINKLLKSENLDDVKEFIKYNEKLNVFEKKIQAILIDHFKIKEGVIDCLLSNDPHLVRRILKCDWFFEDAVPPEFYEKNIFPNVSLSTRCKIINKLARNVKSEQHAEQLFQLTNANYGSQYAEMFLAKCSYKFVSAYITECKPTFKHHNSERNLINICKRFPDIVVQLLVNKIAEVDLYRTRCRWSKLVKHLAKNSPHVFMPFFVRFYEKLFFFNFGKKSTKMLAAELMKLFKDTPHIIGMRKLNISVIFKCLTFEEQILFLKLLVRESGVGVSFENWSMAMPDMRDLLKLKRSNERAQLVEMVFFQLYNEKFLDHPELWSLYFLEIFPTDYRLRLVNLLQEKIGDEKLLEMSQLQCGDPERDAKDMFIYLLSCKSAFPKLTELMTQMTTPERRENLLQEMVRNSIINEDSDGLESVVKYISVRHKNEDPRMIYHLVSDYLMNSRKMFNLNIWESLEQMATLLLVNMSEYGLHQKVLESYIVFKLKNNLNALPQIQNMVKSNFIPRRNSTSLVQEIKKSYSKTLIMLYYNEIFSGDSEYAEKQIQAKLTLGLLQSVNEYNRAHRRTRIKIEDLPLLVESIDTMIKEDNSLKKSGLLKAELLKNPFLKGKYAESLLDLSWESNTLLYMLKCHSDYMINRLDNMMDNILVSYKIRNFKKLFTSKCLIDFLNIKTKIEKITCEKFKTTVSSLVRINALTVYSHIANIENFTELINEYIPSEECFQFDKSKKEFHEIQVNIPQIIKNVKPVSKNLALVLKYINKDYLRMVLPSFFAVCHNSSASVLLPILKDYFPQKQVSAKKVILCCIMDVSVKDEKFKYLQLLWKNEKHSSVKAFIFKAILRCLIQSPSDEIFQMVKKCITEADELTIKGRLHMNVIPVQFLNEYTKVFWEFTEKFADRRFAMNYRTEIINHFNSKNIGVLSQDFCEMIFRLYLFEPNAKIRVENFFSDYILHHPYPMDKKISFMLQMMKERKGEYRFMSHFISNLKDKTRNGPEIVFVIFEAILQEWPKIFDNGKMFREYLLLNYMKAYSTALKAKNSSDKPVAVTFGQEIRKVINGISMYHCYIHVLKSTIYDFIYTFNMVNMLEPILNNFLGDSFGHVEAIIAIYLLPVEMFHSFMMKVDDPEYNALYSIDARKKYSNIFNKLMDKKDDVLETYMNLRMDNALY